MCLAGDLFRYVECRQMQTLKRLKHLDHVSLKINQGGQNVSISESILSEMESMLSSIDHASFYHYHSLEHIINKVMWPFPTPHPYPYLPVYVKGHASMRKIKVTDTRQGEMMKTSEICSGKERWYKHLRYTQARRDGINISGVTSEMKNKRKGKQIA